MKTIRRDKLLRDIRAGLYVARCDGRYTDDYDYDNETNYGVTDFLEINIREDASPAKADHINLYASDFKGHRRAWTDDNGLSVHLGFGCKDFTLVLKSNLGIFRDIERAKRIANDRIHSTFQRVYRQIQDGRK